ncbi:hypothetical protein [Dysgonomonas capnocytophagoides]|uniref:hypothetical protein n=1 Tax=Dysgonomonas capnocytophagoides TaxID=45254 RepID=UPI0033413FED
MTGEQKIEEIESKILDIQQDRTNYKKLANLYCTLIQLKIELNYDKRIVYQDIKLFIKNYLNSKDEEKYGYDLINESKILDIIKMGFNNELEIKISLLKYSEIQIRKLGLPENGSIKKEIEKTEYLILKKQKTFLSRVKCFLYCTSSSIGRIVLTTIVLFALLYIILLPASHEMFAFFQFNIVDFSDYMPLNHLINLVAYCMLLDENIKVVPTTCLGVLFLSLLKLIYIVFVLNYLFQFLLRRIRKIFE